MRHLNNTYEIPFATLCFYNPHLLFAWLYYLTLSPCGNVNMEKIHMKISLGDYKITTTMQEFKDDIENIQDLGSKKQDKWYQIFCQNILYIKTKASSNIQLFIDNCYEGIFEPSHIYKSPGAYNSRIHYMSFWMIEFFMYGQWNCFGPKIYVSKPRIVIYEEADEKGYYHMKKEAAVCILDQESSLVYIVNKNKLLGREHCIDSHWIDDLLTVLPGSYKKNEVVSLKALCYNTFWKYDMLEQLPEKHPALTDVKIIMPMLESIMTDKSSNVATLKKIREQGLNEKKMYKSMTSMRL